MNKVKQCLKTLLCLGIGLMCVNSIGYATEAKKEQNPEVVTRGHMGLDKYISIESFDCNPETEHILNNGEKVYKKNILVKKEFRKDNSETKENLDDIEAVLYVDVTFTYDKNSFVKIDKRDKDIKIKKELKDWKLRNSTEILPSDDVCIVSNKYVTYKKSSLGVGDYIMTGHIDLLCSKLGEIGINTELT